MKSITKHLLRITLCLSFFSHNHAQENTQPLTPIVPPATQQPLVGMDELMQQLDAELVPEAKQPRPQELPLGVTRTTEPVMQIPEKPTTQRSRKRTSPSNAQEQKIMHVFQDKIVPIANGLFKLVESKEAQQLIENAKKKRLEFEKSVATKISSSRKRWGGSSSWGGGSGYSSYRPSRSSWGSSGYGRYGGYSPSSYGSSGYGSGGYSPSGYGSYGQSNFGGFGGSSFDNKSEFNKQDKKQEEQKEEKKDEKGTKIDDKDGGDLRKAETISARLRKKLDDIIKFFNKEQSSGAGLTKGKIEKNLKTLKKDFSDRNDALSKLTPNRQTAIKNKEKQAWENLFRQVKTYQEQCHNMVDQYKQLVDNINKSKGNPKALEALNKQLTGFKEQFSEKIGDVFDEHLEKLNETIEKQIEYAQAINERKHREAQEKQQEQQKPEATTKEKENHTPPAQQESEKKQTNGALDKSTQASEFKSTTTPVAAEQIVPVEHPIIPATINFEPPELPKEATTQEKESQTENLEKKEVIIQTEPTKEKEKQEPQTQADTQKQEKKQEQELKKSFEKAYKKIDDKIDELAASNFINENDHDFLLEADSFLKSNPESEEQARKFPGVQD